MGNFYFKNNFIEVYSSKKCFLLGGNINVNTQNGKLEAYLLIYVGNITVAVGKL